MVIGSLQGPLLVVRWLAPSGFVPPWHGAGPAQAAAARAWQGKFASPDTLGAVPFAIHTVSGLLCASIALRRSLASTRGTQPSLFFLLAAMWVRLYAFSPRPPPHDVVGCFVLAGFSAFPCTVEPIELCRPAPSAVRLCTAGAASCPSLSFSCQEGLEWSRCECT